MFNTIFAFLARGTYSVHLGLAMLEVGSGRVYQADINTEHELHECWANMPPRLRIIYWPLRTDCSRWRIYPRRISRH